MQRISFVVSEGIQYYGTRLTNGLFFITNESMKWKDDEVVFHERQYCWPPSDNLL